MNRKPIHQAWIYEVGPDYLMFRLPTPSDIVGEILHVAVQFVKKITRGMEEDVHLYMENRTILHMGCDTGCILVYSPEFPVGVMVLNASLSKANRIGPYSIRDRKLYKTWHRETPEA